MRGVFASWMIVCLSCGAAYAQQVPESLQGKWKARWDQREVTLTLTASGGTFARAAYYANASHDGCSRLRGDVAVESVAPDEVVIKLLQSKAMKGCSDEQVVLKRGTDAGKVTGAVGTAQVAFVKD